MASTNITLKDLHSFHTIDRELFTRLVLILCRNPGESLIVMAMWLWLQNHASFFNFIFKVLQSPNVVINKLAKEADDCLRLLQSKVPLMQNRTGDMPDTARVMGRAISFQDFYKIRFTMISGIKHYLNNVCSIVFADILVQVLSRGYSKFPLNVPIRVPRFPHPTFGVIIVIPRSLDYTIPNNPFDTIWSLNPEAQVDDRTMFLTFSRGLHVTEEEVVELFNSNYGDCVEDVHMVPPTSSNPRPLYAKMVVRKVSTIDQILNISYIASSRLMKNMFGLENMNQEINIDHEMYF